MLFIDPPMTKFLQISQSHDNFTSLTSAPGDCLKTNYGLVVIHGLPDLHQPHDHEWFCPVAIEVMAAMAADRPKSRSQSSLSRKSSNSSTRKSSAPPVSGVSCKLHDVSDHLHELLTLVITFHNRVVSSFHFLTPTYPAIHPNFFLDHFLLLVSSQLFT